MSYSNYEQSVFFDGFKLSGVQSVAGSYSISEKAINVAGIGFVDSIVNAPMQGDFSFNRKMVSFDPILRTNSIGKYLYDENEFDGAIAYNNDSNGFGFTRGRVNRYSVTCSVGEIPDIQTNITVYGQLGKDVVNYDNYATEDHPEIKFIDQSSIKLSVSDFDIDAISDFSYTRSINLNPVYALGNGDASDWNQNYTDSQNLEPVQVDTAYPIETDINFTMIANKYEIKKIADRLAASEESDVKIEICDAVDNNNIVNSFTGINMKLISESISSSIEDELSISMTYKGFETL